MLIKLYRQMLETINFKPPSNILLRPKIRLQGIQIGPTANHHKRLFSLFITTGKLCILIEHIIMCITIYAFEILSNLILFEAHIVQIKILSRVKK